MMDPRPLAMRIGRAERISVAAAVTAAWLAIASCGSTGRQHASALLPTHDDSIETTLFLVGDAGAPGPPGQSALDALRSAAKQAHGNVVIVFLGDNVYPDGLPDSLGASRREAELRLAESVDAVVGSKARGIFVPGNHDWGSRADTGASALRRQDRFIARRSGGEASMLPEPGCPGPHVVDIGERLRLVALDTEWWLQHATRDAAGGPSCSAHSEREVVTALQSALAGAGNRNVVVVAHHPLVSGAAHGGHFGWREHVFPLRDVGDWLWVPLPVLGSAYPVLRARGAWVEDVANGAYRRMRLALDSAFAQRPPLVYASGHDHNLLVLDGTSARHLLVSGAGSEGRLNRVSWLPSTRFAREANGFIRLELARDGRVRLGVLTVDRVRGTVEAYAIWLI